MADRDARVGKAATLVVAVFHPILAAGDAAQRALDGLPGDEGDLVEILGNLLDNACKWARERVYVRAEDTPNQDGGAGLTLRIHDDGPGIPPDKADAVLARGVRADATRPGHGIGLAVVREIVVEAYGGEISIAASELGGTAVTIRI